MLKKSTVFRLLGLCGIVVLLAVAGLASDFLTRLLTNIDGLLLLMVCLLMGGLFALMLLVLVKESGLIPSHAKPAGEASAAKSGAGK